MKRQEAKHKCLKAQNRQQVGSNPVSTLHHSTDSRLVLCSPGIRLQYSAFGSVVSVAAHVCCCCSDQSLVCNPARYSSYSDMLHVELSKLLLTSAPVAMTSC
jgi:hypothetical protein